MTAEEIRRIVMDRTERDRRAEEETVARNIRTLGLDLARDRDEVRFTNVTNPDPPMINGRPNDTLYIANPRFFGNLIPPPAEYIHPPVIREVIREFERVLARRYRVDHPIRYQVLELATERAYRIVIESPEELNGYEFILRDGFREDEAFFRNIHQVMVARDQAPVRYQDIVPLTQDTWNERTQGTAMAQATNNTMAVDATPVARTSEQEDRYQEINLLANMRELTRAERDEYASLRYLNPFIAPVGARTRVKVTVKASPNNGYGGWSIAINVLRAGKAWAGIALPSYIMLTIRGLVPDSEKHWFSGRARGDRGIQEILEAGCSPIVIKDALTAWIVAKESQVTEASGDTVIEDEALSLLRMMPATLEVGGKVFRLVPTREVDVRPLITRIRGKVINASKVEGEAIKVRASTDARMVVSEAERRASRIREEIAALQRNQGSKVPEWVRLSGRPHYFFDGGWFVEVRIGCKVTDIRFTLSEWNTILHWSPIVVKGEAYYRTHPMRGWVRLREEGNYDVGNIFLKEWDTTHISHSATCMHLQGLPASLDSLENLNGLESCLTRGMQVVNLNSPLNRVVGGYYPDFLEQLPVTVVEWLKGNVGIRGGTLAGFKASHPEIATWSSEETIEQEVDSTFRVDDPRIIHPSPVVATPPMQAPHVAAIERGLRRAYEAAGQVAMPAIPERER